MMKMRNTYWHLSRNDDAFWMEEAVAALKSNTWTTPLYIDGSKWNCKKERTARALMDCIATGENTSCESFIFQNATLNSTTERSFTNAMAHNTSLRSVTLRKITSLQASILEEAYPLPPAVFSNTKLESLYLVRVGLNEESCQSLVHLLQTSTSLTSLTLDAVHISSGDAGASLLEAIASSPSLTQIRLEHLDQNEWNMHHFFQTAATSHANTPLSHLHVESCQLKASHAPLVARFVQDNVTLKQLSLRHNLFDGNAVQIIVSQGLNENTTLKRLLLSRNPLQSASAELLQCLRHTRLQELCLLKCHIPEAACQQLLKALKGSTALRKLHLDGNEVNVQHVLDLLQSNLHLTAIMDRLPVLTRNGRKDSESWKRVQFMLRANQSHRQILPSLDSQPRPLISHVLSRSAVSRQSDLLFHAVRHMAPQFVVLAGAPTAPTAPTPIFSHSTIAWQLHALKLQEHCTIQVTTFKHQAKPRLLVPRSA